jgi:hypothetical protein
MRMHASRFSLQDDEKTVVSFTVCMAAASSFFTASLPLLFLDGTFCCDLLSSYRLLIAASVTASDNLLLLGFRLCGSETGSEYEELLNAISTTVPSLNASPLGVMSDRLASLVSLPILYRFSSHF